MSTNGSKSVRFAASEDERGDGSGGRNGHGRADGAERGGASRIHDSSRDEADHRPLKKRKVVDSMNADELDDIDDWNAEHDDDGANGVSSGSSAIPREHELLRAKRERRTKRTLDAQRDYDDEHEEDFDTERGTSRSERTRIDNRTSLVSDGIEVEPFHMDNERSDGSGYFDGDTYVFRKSATAASAGQDGLDEPDAWLEGLDEAKYENDESSEARQSRVDAMVRADARREQKNKDDEDRMDLWSEQDLYAKIVQNLGNDDETVMQALVRYGNLFQVKKGAKEGSTTAPSTAASRQLAQTSFNELTEAANALLLKGKIDIYQMKRAAVRALLPQQPLSSTTATNSAKPVVKWEYRGNQDGAIHGLYSTEDMLGWIQAGYFVGATAVQVRTVQQPVEQPPAKKSMQDDLLSDLMDDDEVGNSVEQVHSVEPIRGEWVLSDSVDFKKYVTSDDILTDKN